ncbi:MAG: four helix bundle protein [Planctomycetaceae bacterium]|nr:four helix bundle protein [Planctomycetaceae bacterium]
MWQKAMDVVLECYSLTDAFPKDERFGLTQQLRRAVVSIPSNIAEGKGRGTTGAYLNHLSIAAGSIAEVDTQMELAKKLNYVDASAVEPLILKLEEIGRMISGLKRSLEGRANS